MTQERLKTFTDDIVDILEKAVDGYEKYYRSERDISDRCQEVIAYVESQQHTIDELEQEYGLIRDFVERCADGFYRSSTVSDVRHDAVHLLSETDNTQKEGE